MSSIRKRASTEALQLVSYLEVKDWTHPLKNEKGKDAYCPSPIQHCTGDSSHCSKVGRYGETEGEEQENCLFADEIIAYIENPKASSKQLLEKD